MHWNRRCNKCCSIGASAAGRVRGARRLLAVPLLLALAAAAQAQGVARLGTIDYVDPGEHVVVVSGSELKYEARELQVLYREREVPVTVLRSGLRISYRTDASGELRQVTLLGPVHLLDLLTTH